jgi:peptidoglycan hydrolase-like protein with peptidoglycan-binding domain
MRFFVRPTAGMGGWPAGQLKATLDAEWYFQSRTLSSAALGCPPGSLPAQL